MDVNKNNRTTLLYLKSFEFIKSSIKANTTILENGKR